MSMSWANVKWIVNNLPEAELLKPAAFYDTYFKRTCAISAIDHLSSLEGDYSGTNSPLVLMGNVRDVRT